METLSPLLSFQGIYRWQYIPNTNRPVTKSVNIVIAVSLNKLSNKQSSCWWLETPLRSCGTTCLRSVHVSNVPSGIGFSPRLLFTQVVNKSSFNFSTSNDNAKFICYVASSWILIVAWIYNVKFVDLGTVGKRTFNYSDVRWASWRVTLPPTRLFAQNLVQAGNKGLPKLWILAVVREIHR